MRHRHHDRSFAKLWLVALALALGVTAGAPRAARADLAGLDTAPYKVNREKGEVPLDKGRLFFEHLQARDAEVAASVTEAVRFAIHDEETQKFTRQKAYVLWAYGALWVILIGFAVGMFAKQRKLAAELTALEARVQVEKG